MSFTPNLIIAGVAKAGTTSLYHYLTHHPNIYMSPLKETNYFSEFTPEKKQRFLFKKVSDEAEYLSLFDNVQSERIIGEASPVYMWDKHSPTRIKNTLPDAKILISLRNPIQRAFSHYLMDVREGIQNKPFREALAEDYALESKEWGVAHLYIELGMYADQIERYINLFGTENVYILFFEELIKNTDQILRDIYSFLGVDSIEIKNGGLSNAHNAYAAPRGALAQKLIGNHHLRMISRQIFPRKFRLFCRNNILWQKTEKPKIDADSMHYLKNFYKPEIPRLRQLLNRTVPWEKNIS